jgi:surface antigen
MFQIRNSRPGAGNKCYITRGNGGWSWCIQGSPTDSACDVLANCVGYACGRFNEIYNEIKGTSGMKYYALNCNAENFIERARSTYGLEVVGYPVKGGIMVWQGAGSLAGHVAIVEKVYDSNHIYTSESGYGGSAFWNSHRYNTNGRWGLGASYPFLGCIVNPAVGKVTTDDEPTPTPTPGPVGKFKVGDKVYIEGNLYVSSNAGSPAGYTAKKLTNITRVNAGSAHPYNTTGDLGWMDESSITAYVEPTPAPAPTPAPSNELKVGDRVKIIGTGNGSSYGTSNTAGGIGWTRYITAIHAGRPFPYQVGNQGKTDSANTTGFYKASSLQKI